MLRALLAKLDGVPLHNEDVCVFLGDYVDRGEDSRAVIETLLEWRERRPDSIFLRGNHEQLMLDVRDAPDGTEQVERARLSLIWLQNGGSETLLSYGVPGFREWFDVARPVLKRLPLDMLQDLKDSFELWLDAIPEPHWQFLRDTEMEYVTERYHFVHAGLLAPGQTWEAEGWSIDPRLWIREPFVSSRADFGGRIVIFGHTPQGSGRPLIHSNKVGLDTGAVFGGPLTAAVFDPRPREGAPQPARTIQIPYIRAISSLLKTGPAQKPSARRRASSARSSRK